MSRDGHLRNIHACSRQVAKERSAGHFGKQRWHSIPYQRGDLLLRSMEDEPVLESLYSRPLSEGDVPVFEWMRKPAPSEAVEPGGYGRRRLRRVKPAVDISMTNSVGTRLVGAHPQVDRKALKPPARRYVSQPF